MEHDAAVDVEVVTCWEDDDLSSLPELDEGTLLKKLDERYSHGRIYSYVGDILIAINPFRNIPLYTDQLHVVYDKLGSIQNVAPHIYAVADCAYRTLCVTNTDQVVVISGESGAGKTEAAKHLIRHVLKVCRSPHSDIGDQILKVNTLLESLGNAVTVMNKNSSRFGKFLRLHFSSNGTISGASLAHYLLEKSRVVQQNKGEGNFHIFYLLMAGLDAEQKARMNLTSCSDFNYLNGSKSSKDKDKDKDKDRDLPTLPSNAVLQAQFKELQQAMVVVGFEESDINGLFSAVAAILHIGNLSFTDKSDKAKLLNPDTLAIVASLIGVDTAQLLAALTMQYTVACSETIKRFNTKSKAINYRDSLAKLIYSCVFDWVINLLNTMLSPCGADQPPTSLHSQDVDMPNSDLCVLDIFGFENFQYNSFEQFCINIANEQLHFYFNQCIFAWELQEYAREGIRGVDGILYTNNQETIELFFSKPVGMLALLDEESKLQKATPLTLCSKFNNNCKGHPSFVKSKQQSRPLFALQHYAGKVDYDATTFLSKNQDAISDSIVNCLQESSNEFIQTAVGVHFKNQSKYSSDVSKNVGNVLLKCEIPAFQVSGKSTLSSSSKKRRSQGQKRAGSVDSNDSFPVACSPRGLETDSAKKKLRRSGKTSLGFSTRSSKKNLRKIAATAQIATVKKPPTTIANFFKMSLGDLISKMLMSMPHFVRCIKPNSKQNPNMFERDFVQRQLRYTGVLDTCRIRQAGFPVRLSFPAFLTRYSHLVATYQWVVANAADASTCKIVLDKLGLKNYAIGQNKVFLRFYHNEALCHKLEDFLAAVILFQRNARRSLAQARYLRIMKEKRAVDLYYSALAAQEAFRTRLTALSAHDDMEHERLVQERLEEERRRRQEEEEAERQRLAEEAERKRLEEQEAERKRLAEEAERKRLAEEAEQKRLAEEAEQARLAEEAETKRLAEEAERQRLKEEARTSTLASASDGAASDAVQMADEGQCSERTGREGGIEPGDDDNTDAKLAEEEATAERERLEKEKVEEERLEEEAAAEQQRERRGRSHRMISVQESPASWKQEELDDEYIPKRIRDRETFSSSAVQVAARNALMQKRLKRTSELGDGVRFRSGSFQVSSPTEKTAQDSGRLSASPHGGSVGTLTQTCFSLDENPSHRNAVCIVGHGGFDIPNLSSPKTPRSRNGIAAFLDMAQDMKKSKKGTPNWSSPRSVSNRLKRNESVRSASSNQSKEEEPVNRQEMLERLFSRPRAASCATTGAFASTGGGHAEGRLLNKANSSDTKSSLDSESDSPGRRGEDTILSLLRERATSIVSLIDTDEECNASMRHVFGDQISLGVDTDEESNNQLGIVTRSPLAEADEGPYQMSARIDITAPVPEVAMLKRGPMRRSGSSDALDTDEECNIVQPILVLPGPRAAKKICASSDADDGNSQVSSLGGDSDDDLPIPETEKNKKRRSYADQTGKSISDEWRKLAKFANQDTKRAMSTDRTHVDDVKDSKQTKKARHDTLLAERERLQAEVNELVKLRDEVLLDNKIAEYSRLKEEAVTMQTEAVALRSEVDQMKVDIEDDVVRACNLKQTARKELLMVLAMSDRLMLKPKAVLKSLELKHSTTSSRRASADPSFERDGSSRRGTADYRDSVNYARGVDMAMSSSVPDLSNGEPSLQQQQQQQHSQAPSPLSRLMDNRPPLPKPRCSFPVISTRQALHADAKSARSKSETVPGQFVALLDQSDKESVKVAEHVLFSADGSMVRQAMASAHDGLDRASSLTDTGSDVHQPAVATASSDVHVTAGVPDSALLGNGTKRTTSFRKLGRQRYVQDKRATKQQQSTLIAAGSMGLCASNSSIASCAKTTSESLPKPVACASDHRVVSTSCGGAAPARQPRTPEGSPSVQRSTSFSPRRGFAISAPRTSADDLGMFSSRHGSEVPRHAALQIASPAASPGGGGSSRSLAGKPAGMQSLSAQTSHGSASLLFRPEHSSPRGVHAAGSMPSMTGSIGTCASSSFECLDDLLGSPGAAGAAGEAESKYCFEGPAQSYHSSVSSTSLHRAVSKSSVSSVCSGEYAEVDDPEPVPSVASDVASSSLSAGDIGMRSLSAGDLTMHSLPASDRGGMSLSTGDLTMHSLPASDRGGMSLSTGDITMSLSTGDYTSKSLSTGSIASLSLSTVDLATKSLSAVDEEAQAQRGVRPNALTQSKSFACFSTQSGNDNEKSKNCAAHRSASTRVRPSRVRAVVRQLERRCSSQSLDHCLVRTADFDAFPIPRPGSQPVEEALAVTHAEPTQEERIDADDAAEMFSDEPWCRVTSMELNSVSGIYSIFNTRLTVDGSLQRSAGRLGLNSMPVVRGLSIVEEIRHFIGRGVELNYRPDGCLYATRRTQNSVTVKGWNSVLPNCLPPSLVERKGKLELDVPTKIYDIELFREHMISLITATPVDQSKALSICKVALSFVRDQRNPLHTPCWIVIDLVSRHNDISAVLSLHADALAVRGSEPWAAARVIDPLMEFAARKDVGAASRRPTAHIVVEPETSAPSALSASIMGTSYMQRLHGSQTATPQDSPKSSLDDAGVSRTSARPSLSSVMTAYDADRSGADDRSADTGAADVDRVSLGDSLMSPAPSVLSASHLLVSPTVSVSTMAGGGGGSGATESASATSLGHPAAPLAPDGQEQAEPPLPDVKAMKSIVAELSSLAATTKSVKSIRDDVMTASQSKSSVVLAGGALPLLTTIKQRNNKLAKTNTWSRLALKTKSINK